MSLRVIIPLCFMLTASLPLAVFWLWPHSHVLAEKIADVRERNLLVAETISAELSRYHDDIHTAMDSFAELLVQGDAEVARDTFVNLHFRHLCVMDKASGRTTYTLLSAFDACPEVVPAHLQNLFASLTKAHRTGFSGVQAPGGGEPRIYVVSSYKDKLIVGAIRTTFFKMIQERVQFGQNGHAVIIDQFNRVIAHPNDKWEIGIVDMTGMEAVDHLRGGETINRFYSPNLDSNVIAGFAEVANAGWGIMVPQPMNELRASAAAVNQRSALVFTLGVAMSVAIGALLSIALARSIDAIRGATSNVASGKVETRIPSQSRVKITELEALRTGFNAMAESIETATMTERGLRKEAEQQSIAKGHFLAVLSHEIRTPLNGMLGHSQLLLRQRLTKSQAKIANTLLTSGRTLLSILDNVLDFSKIEAGFLTVIEEPFDIQSVVRSSTELFEATAADKGLSLNLDIRPGRSAVVIGDEGRLRQIVQNLVNNAIKFTDKGSVTVRLETERNSEKPDELNIDISVIDTGVGIEPDMLDHIFEAFTQAGEVSRSKKGSGLGLAICARLAEALDAELTAQSLLGRGSTFRLKLCLPVVELPESATSETQRFIDRIKSGSTKHRA